MSEPDLYQRMVSELALPKDFTALLEEPLKSLGYSVISHDDVLDIFDAPLKHNCAQVKGNYVALLHLSKEVITSGDATSHIFQLGVRFSEKVAALFFFTPAPDFNDIIYNQTIAKKLVSNRWPSLCAAEFFKYGVLEHLRTLTPEGQKQFLSNLLGLKRLPTPAPAPPAPVTQPPPVPPTPGPDEEKLLIDPRHTEALVEILVGYASAGRLLPREYLKGIIDGVALPNEVRTRMLDLSGDANIDAQNMVRVASGYTVNVRDKKYTVLGSILRPLLKEGAVKTDDQRVVAGIIYYNRLFLDEGELLELAQRFQIPDLPPAAADAAEGHRGAPFEPHLPSDTKVLQSFFRKKPPELIDVGIMKAAMKRTSAVCHVEIPGGRTGTGFLIAPRLVLTNYHVLNFEGRETDRQMKDNALQATLRFAYISAGPGRAEEGRPYRLDRENPIVESSPIAKCDFALLRVEEAIDKAEEIEPVSYTLEAPALSTTLNMIQHPEGRVMQIALSGNGVIWKSDDSRLIQYATPAAQGSSGSPCFNDKWEVVAIHHAEETRRFAGIIDAGTVREGILFGRIYEQIEKHLR